MRTIPVVLAFMLFTGSGTSLANTSSQSAKASHECIIEPNVTLALGSEIQGLIDELYVERGDTVREGEIVALLKSGVESRRVEQASKRADMVGEITAREADLDLATIVLERAESLYRQQLAPSQEYDEARAQFRVAQAALQQAMDNKEQLKLELLLAKSMLAQRIVRSPVNGVVVEHHAYPGEFVHDNPIMTIAQLDPLRVEVVLPLMEFGKFKAGDVVYVEPELGGPAIKGAVDIVDPLLDSSSGTFGLRILVDNKDGALLAGQKCRVNLQGRTASRAASADDKL